MRRLLAPALLLIALAACVEREAEEGASSAAVDGDSSSASDRPASSASSNPLTDGEEGAAGTPQWLKVQPGDTSVVVDGIRYTVRDGALIVHPVVRRSGRREGAAGTGDLEPEDALWTPVKEWRSHGERTTESFAVRTAEWRIVAERSPTKDDGTLAVTVKGPGGARPSRTSGRGAGADTVYPDGGPGVFWLELEGYAMRWTVRVDEKRRPAERPSSP